MASYNVTQLHRVVFRTKTSDGWSTLEFGPDDLGADSQATLNIAPRKMSRSSSKGTTETPIVGTYDAFAGSVTFLMDTWSQLGKALGRGNAATYDGATAQNGHVLGDSTNRCAGGDYKSVIVQGVCDDGSTVDLELPRCIPSVDDDIEIGTSETAEQTLNLNPIVYNPSLHSTDGYPQYDYRLGDNSLTEKQRLNPTTGEYAAVSE